MTRHPNRCQLCGSNYGHERGCANLRLLQVQEDRIRMNPEDHSTYDVECLLHEIDVLRQRIEELKHTTYLHVPDWRQHE